MPPPLGSPGAARQKEIEGWIYVATLRADPSSNRRLYRLGFGPPPSAAEHRDS